MAAKTNVDGSVGGTCKLSCTIVGIDLVQEKEDDTTVTNRYYTLNYAEKTPNIRVKLVNGNIDTFA